MRIATREEETAEDRGSKSELLSIRDVLRAVVRTISALRMYGERVPADRLETQLLDRVTRHLEQWGVCHFTVEEHGLVLDGETAHMWSGRGDPLASLARDGVSRLSLTPGLDRTELHDFLLLLGRSGDEARGEDLVTALWERGFEFISYALVEDLGVAGHLAQPPEAGPADDGVQTLINLDTMLELDQPVAHLPVASCEPTAEEMSAIQAELNEADRSEDWREIVELAAELCILEPDVSVRLVIEQALIATADRFRDETRPLAAVSMLEYLGELSRTTLNDSERLPEIEAALAVALAAPERLRPLLAGLGRDTPITPSQLTAFIARLGPAATVTVLEWMEEAPEPALHRAAAEALLLGGDTLSELKRHFGHQADPAPARIREALDLLSLSPALVLDLPLVGQLLHHADPEVRLALALALGPCAGGADGTLATAWLTLARDGDPRIARHAVESIVESGDREYLGSLQAETRRPELAGASPERKRLLFTAVARLGRDEALPWLAGWLAPGRRRMLVSRRTRETENAVIEAIRSIGSSASRDLLAELACSPDRHLRTAAAAGTSGRRR